MRKNIWIAMGLWFSIGFVLSQEKEFPFTQPSVEMEDGKEPLLFRNSLSGLEEFVLSIKAIPPVLSVCQTKSSPLFQDVETIVMKRFADELHGPKIRKEDDRSLPHMELRFECVKDESDNDSLVIMPKMKITNLSTGKKKDSSKILFEADTVWQGFVPQCWEGLQKAIQALLDNFLADYRTANPSKRLPSL